jgi:hypothetical protein
MEHIQFVSEKNFLHVRDLDESLSELKSLRSEFPLLEELLQCKEELELELEGATSSKSYETAAILQSQLKALKEQVVKEKLASGIFPPEIRAKEDRNISGFSATPSKLIHQHKESVISVGKAREKALKKKNCFDEILSELQSLLSELLEELL